MTQFKCLLLIALVTFSGGFVETGAHGQGKLRDNYYRKSCKNAEAVIEEAVLSEVEKDLKLAAGLIRLQFHDCFVEGCDASVLLEGHETEKHAPVNEKLTGYGVIDAAKAAVEAECPGVVSCADIIAYAARDSAVRLGGSSWAVQGGRKDGVHSQAASAEADLPPPEFQVSQLIESFARRGLSRKQMVVLSGAHTVGVGHCDKVVGRLYNFNKRHFTDPTIDPVYAAELKSICPQKTFNTTVEILMDVVTATTAGEFNSDYYTTVKDHKGLFTSDQSLFQDSRTKKTVQSLTNNDKFQREFGKAMRALGAVGVQTRGQVRRNCQMVNH